VYIVHILCMLVYTVDSVCSVHSADSVRTQHMQSNLTSCLTHKCLPRVYKKFPHKKDPLIPPQSMQELMTGWVDSVGGLSTHHTHCAHHASRCYKVLRKSGKRCCPSASSQASMLAGVGMVCIGAAMPNGAGGGYQGTSGSDKPAYSITPHGRGP